MTPLLVGYYGAGAKVPVWNIGWADGTVGRLDAVLSEMDSTLPALLLDTLSNIGDAEALRAFVANWQPATNDPAFCRPFERRKIEIAALLRVAELNAKG